MFLPIASRLNAVQRISNTAVRTKVCSAAGPGLLRAIRSPQWTAVNNKTWSYARTETTAATQNKKQRFKFPEYLNVYRAGTFKTVFMGFFRIVTIVMFPVGCIYAQNFYFSPLDSSWWAPVFVLASAIPMSVMMLATGPYVHAIRIRLPPRVRMSREELLRFAENTPSDAEVRLECMRALPWPTKRDVKFGLLRKYRPSLKKGFSNLEYVPEHTGDAKGQEDTWWHNLVKNFLGRFMVDNLVHDKSSSPGLWAKLWKQIPEAGSVNDPTMRFREERKPVAMANRPQREANTSAKSQIRPPQRSGGVKR